MMTSSPTGLPPPYRAPAPEHRAFNPALDQGGPAGRSQASRGKFRARSVAGANTATADTLREWLQAVADQQDPEAFARLHAFFAPRLTAYLTRAGLSHALAEDIVQDAMLAVWRKAKLFDHRHGRVTTWVFVIARNLRVDYLRRRARRGLAPLEAIDVIDAGPTGEETLLTAEREASLHKALAQLSTEQALILEQAYFKDKPQTAIARDLGVPLGTVKSRSRLALARLKKLLSEAM